MTAVGFYHLTRTGPDAALPALLGRTLAAGARAVVQVRDPARVAALDTALWAATDPDWLPHGTARTGHAPLQPIWITDTEAQQLRDVHQSWIDERRGRKAADRPEGARRVRVMQVVVPQHVD